MSGNRHLRWGRLAVVPTAGGCRVAAEDDPEDWVVSFDESEALSAREWAERMVAAHNLRLATEGGGDGPGQGGAAGAP